MKRNFFSILIHTIFIYTSLLSAENKPVKRIEQLNGNLLFQLSQLHQHDVFDTLAHSYDQPLGYFEEPFQRMIEATKLRPQSKCRLHSIHIAFYNDINGTVSKDIEFYLWKNKQGLPGKLMYSEQKRVRMNELGFQWFRLDLADTLIYLEGDFWIGHKELTSGFPTSVIDGIQTMDRTNFYAENGMEWFEEDYDYLQLAVVQYTESGEPEIAITPDTLIFQVTATSDSNGDDDDQASKIDDIRTNCFEGGEDTLSNEYNPPFFSFYEKYRTAYEATRLFSQRPAVVKEILTAFINSDQTERSKTCEFFIWTDSDNLPGNIVFRDSLEVRLRQGEMSWKGIDFSDKPITVSGYFWIGHREHGTGYPTSLVDESAVPGSNFTSTDGMSWSEEDYDYLQQAIVDYQADPMEGVSQFTIYNVGTLGLEVSNIHSDRNWVREIGPSVFSIAADDSQVVRVHINASGLEPGVYDGKLLIESNDPSAPLVEKNTRLIVHGQTGVDHFFQKDTPDNFSLIGNYPNPFNPSTKIEYEIHQATYVVLNIYNILGQLVASLIDEKQVPGRYSLDWNGVDRNGSPLSGGVYICRMTAANFEKTIKLTLLR